jgi:hypothetical protein
MTAALVLAILIPFREPIVDAVGADGRLIGWTCSVVVHRS